MAQRTFVTAASTWGDETACCNFVEWNEVGDLNGKITELSTKKADSSDLKAACRDISKIERETTKTRALLDGTLANLESIKAELNSMVVEVRSVKSELRQEMLSCLENGSWKKAFLKGLRGDLAAIDSQISLLVEKIDFVEASKTICVATLTAIQNITRHPSPEFLQALSVKIRSDAALAIEEIRPQLTQFQDAVIEANTERLSSEQERRLSELAKRLDEISRQAQRGVQISIACLALITVIIVLRFAY